MCDGPCPLLPECSPNDSEYDRQCDESQIDDQQDADEPVAGLEVPERLSQLLLIVIAQGNLHFGGEIEKV